MIWRTAGAQQSVLSTPLLPPPFLPLPPRKKKEEGTFYYRDISGEEFFYSFKLIPKNRRRVKITVITFLKIQKQKGCNCNYFAKDGNSSDSIVPVASTHEFPQCLMLLCVIAQRFVELTISTSWRGSSWSCQDSSTWRVGPLDITIQE